MMPYTELQQTFIRHLQTAVAEYQALYTRRAMPAHRATDIAAITELLNSPVDSEQLRTELTTLLIQFKTGWFIFRTGNSRLRDNIQVHLSNPQYSTDAFLKSRILELELTARTLEQVTPLEHVLRNFEGLTQDEEIQVALRKARQALAESRKTIQTLSTDNETLRTENARLDAENEQLKEKNHRLSGRLQSKRLSQQLEGARPMPIHNNPAKNNPEEMDVETISPGTSIARSLKAFPPSWNSAQ